MSIRHFILGAASREERAGSDREVWRAPGNTIFAGSADLNGGEVRREVKGAKGAFRTVRYALVQLRLKPARFVGARVSETRMRCALPVSLPANARKHTMAPPSNHRR